MTTLVGGTEAATQELAEKQLSFYLAMHVEIATLRDSSLDAMHARVMGRWEEFMEFWATTRGRTAAAITAPKVLEALREFDARLTA